MNMRHIAIAAFLFIVIALATGCEESQTLETYFEGDGAVRTWLVAGTFPNRPIRMLLKTVGTKGFITDYLAAAGGETNARPEEGEPILFGERTNAVWRAYTSRSAILDFHTALPHETKTNGTHRIAYAYTTFSAKRETRALIAVGCDDSVRVWLNGVEVLNRFRHDHPLVRDEFITSITFKKGKNRILVKVGQKGGKWQLSLRIAKAVMKAGHVTREGASLSLTLPKHLAGETVDILHGERSIANALLTERGDVSYANVLPAPLNNGDVSKALTLRVNDTNYVTREENAIIRFLSFHAKSAHAIKETRMGELSITASSNTPVRVMQREHEFIFGAHVPWQTFATYRQELAHHRARNEEQAKAFAAKWKGRSAERRRMKARAREHIAKHFNALSIEDALTWRAVEPEGGDVSYENADRAVVFAKQHGMTTRGCALLPSFPWDAPDRVVAMTNDDDAKTALKTYVVRTVRKYRGRVDEYDLVSSMLRGMYYINRFGEHILTEAATWAKDAYPTQALAIHEYDVVNGRSTSPFVEKITRATREGVPFTALACEGACEITLRPEVPLLVLDTILSLNRPLTVTGFAVRGEDTVLRAKVFETMLRTLFAHKVVSGIYFANATSFDGTGASPALFDNDGNATPLGSVYRVLVETEWRTDITTNTGASGTVTLPAFFGTYDIVIGKRTYPVTLEKARGSVAIEVAR